jgi:superfamily II DNA/RNA helicase
MVQAARARLCAPSAKRELKMSFDTLNLHETLSRALAAAGYTEPTSVQAEAIPAALAGKDLMVSSRTGSGKTASFVLPALTLVLKAREQQRAAQAQAQQAAAPQDGQAPQAPRAPRAHRDDGFRNGPRPFVKPRGPRVLVLCPTRELAMQVAKAAMDYGRYVPGLSVATIVGGVPYPAQLKALRGPLDILIATPGRLIDHLGAGKAVLENIEMLVLDEADRMLDMGFIDDIHRIAQSTPEKRQTVMFSATFSGATGGLAKQLLRDPQRIDVASHTDTHADIEQRLHWADDFGHKNALLDHIHTGREVDQALVFTSTQRDAEVLAERLAEMGHSVEALHGGMPQGRRNRVLQSLRNKRVRVLVATDVAARGIDVPTISHVINFGLPMKEEDYVHRIGRTGRAGRTGLAVTLAERRDFGMIQRIQRFTTQRMPVATITGLEPKRVEPKPMAPRPGPGGKPAGKSFGPRPFGSKPFKPAGKTFAKKAGPRPAR